MRNQNIFSLIITVITVCSLASCELDERVIELESHDSRLVLNAQIYQNLNEMKVVLSRSIGITDTFYNEDNLTLTDNSTITLYTPDQGTIEGYIYQEPNEFDEVQAPLWKFDYDEFLSGETYTIEAETEGYDLITSETTIPSRPMLVDVDFTPSLDTEGNSIRDRFEIKIDDPAEEDNYYYITASREVTEGNFSYDVKYRFFDAPQNPIDESFIENRIKVFSDKNFNGTDYSLVVYGERDDDPFSEVTFTIFQISKEAYEYQEAYEKSNTDSPFAEPVTFPNNIENGYGLFAISSEPAIKLITI